MREILLARAQLARLLAYQAILVEENVIVAESFYLQARSLERQAEKITMSQHSELTREDWQEMDFTPVYTDKDMCVCCGEHPVTWPRVCENCQDKEAQAELSMRYENEGVEASSMACRNCGMIYDGGQSCSYCGDTNPMDDWDIEEDE